MAVQGLNKAVEDEVRQACRKLDASDSILIVVDSRLLHEAITHTVDYMLSRDTYGLYVSLNKPHDIVKSMLHRACVKTERLYFVDCVSPLVHKALTKHDEHLIYSSNPNDLVSDGRIPQEVERFIKSLPGEKFILIDALRTLFIYNEPEMASSFIHSLLSLTSRHELKIIALTRNDDAALLSMVSKAFDEVYSI